MGFWCTRLQTGLVDNILYDYSLALSVNLHDATSEKLDFPQQSSRFIELTKWRASPWSFGKKTDLFIFQLMFISIFQKTEASLSCLAHAGENSWEIAKKELSNWRPPLSFLSNCGVQISAETALTWSRLSDWEMGGNIQTNLLKTSAVDVQSARVFLISFFGLGNVH